MIQRLSGASLLVFANKTDVNGCMDEAEIREVSEMGAGRSLELEVSLGKRS